VVQRIRPASAPAAAGAPQVQPAVADGHGWATDRAVRPLVYVTLGTVSNHATGVFRTILDGLAPLPVDVLVTVGPHGDPAALAPTPPNVRVERFVPQEEVLPRCSVVVTHCGAGSALGALAHGRPLLAVPQGADQFANAARVVAVGAGVRLLPADVSSEGVYAALQRLLGDDRYTAAARRLRDEIAAMPAPSEGVAALARLVDRQAGSLR
jgi:MGT family glycosyltransferase